MEAVAATAARADEAVDGRVRTGEQEAFIALYNTQFEGVFDFALRVLRDRDLAATVVRRAFSNGNVSRDELYLYARECALDQLRYRRRGERASGDREGLAFTNVDAGRLSDPSAVVFDRDLVELVWDAAAALSPEDYSLLDLLVRRDLGAHTLADQARVTHLRESFEDTVRSKLLAARGRMTCSDLDNALTEFGADQATRDVLRAVRQHTAVCRRCQETKRRYVSPAEVLASLVPIPPNRNFRREFEKQLPKPSEGWMRRLRKLV